MSNSSDDFKKIVVGLGNPGCQYQNTPHNLGFELVDRLAEENRSRWQMTECYALTAFLNLEDFSIILAKPQTFVNLSGKSVALLLQKFGLSANDLIVACDDLSLPFGKIRIRGRGSSGGHKGLESIIQWLNRNDFIRVRLGIAPESKVVDAAEYVLCPIPSGLKDQVEQMILRGKEAIKMIYSLGIQPAMNQFN